MKRTICFLLVIVITALSIFPIVAANEIMPRYNNTAATSTNFTITSSGEATITATYDGYRGITTGATVTSYIEKRTLGIFWTKVDIGETDNQWLDSSNNYYDIFVHEFQLDKTGTYRATVVYEISGTGGATDVIEYEQERTYS